jgi:iron complex outermembrane receptor protein
VGRAGVRRALSVSGVAAVALVAAAPALQAQQVLPQTQQSIDATIRAAEAQDAAAAAAAAAPAAGAPDQGLQEVVVTGTRSVGLTEAESPAPLQVVSSAQLQSVASSPTVMATLSQVVPAFKMQSLGGDQANQTISANLYGCNPNDTLVLVNGKRRHGTSNVQIDASQFQGSAAPDLSLIPQDAIEHVEVLTEGAAAQYGSDAVCGVINFILKHGNSGGMADYTHGGYYAGGGVAGNGADNDVAANAGFVPFDGAFLNVTGEIHNQAVTDHTGIDPRVLPSGGNIQTYPDNGLLNTSTYPYLDHIQGNAEIHLKLAEMNGGYDFGDSGNTQFYVFGTYSQKNADSYEYLRLPHRVSWVNPTTGETIYPFPYGFDPKEGTVETDWQLNGGFKGNLAGFRWDLATGYGYNKGDQYTLGSANAGLPYPQITQALGGLKNFYDGYLGNTQWTTTLDVAQDFDVGMAGPLTIAFGGEYRRDVFKTGAGEPDSWENGGAQSYPGFTPTDAGVHSRTDGAEYLDFVIKPLSPLLIDIAGRHEHYSDFGNANIGKLVARWDISDQFAIRGSAQNGFRAPTLAEEYYSSTAVTPTTAFAILPPDSPGGRIIEGLLGTPGGLQPEKSTNFSLGLVYRPTPTIITTLDLYQITIKNRIQESGGIIGSSTGAIYAPAIIAALRANGNQIDPAVLASGTTGMNIFTNGISTRAQGADFKLNIPVNYDFGSIAYSLAATYEHISYYNVKGPPAAFNTSVNPFLFDLTALSNVTSVQPLYQANLGLLFTHGAFSANLQEIIYGSASQWGNDDYDNPVGVPLYYNSKMPVTPITNLTLNFDVTKHLTLALGANNLFNRFPPGINPTILQHECTPAYQDPACVAYQQTFVPYGINGAYYFGKAYVRW